MAAVSGHPVPTNSIVSNAVPAPHVESVSVPPGGAPTRDTAMTFVAPVPPAWLAHGTPGSTAGSDAERVIAPVVAEP